MAGKYDEAGRVFSVLLVLGVVLGCVAWVVMGW